jgi:hypothetical protein
MHPKRQHFQMDVSMWYKVVFETIPNCHQSVCRATLSFTMCHIGTTLRCPNKLPFSSSQDKFHLPQTTFSQPHDNLRNQTPTCHCLSSHTTMVILMWGLLLVKSSPKRACHSTPPYGINILIDSLGHFGQHPHWQSWTIWISYFSILV